MRRLRNERTPAHTPYDAPRRGGERNVHVAIVSTYLVADDKGERVRVLDERIDDQLHRPSALVRPVGPTSLLPHHCKQ